MDISIIISGNLTGFSRFYASPNANDIYNEAKFDFDYRNFLTFINAGEKAYAISFSPKVIAVSLITRILDSFRRPGILVVTALIPRYQLVSGTLNAQDKSAIYRLLNEINEKFYEKNFLNGMVNQNPAVLMQDYYSDILRNYALVSDRMQKAINTTIEVNSPNKRIGYISASEKDIPKYLSSLMRKSYNGYHHVFFADKAPMNIDEPADEIVTYRARIENGNRNVPGEVRLTDKIPTVTPEQGERPLSNTNFTYGQVLNGEAGTDIIATIDNDTIVLTFRFPKEEKTVYFKFFEGANELPIPLIRPILVESNETSLNLSSDSFTFYGKEIYGRKTIKSGNPEYTIDPTTSVLDLQRCNNGSTVNVYVRRGWELIFNFRNANYPKTIILSNRYTHEQERFDNVRDSIHQLIPGNKSEWDMEILSDYYETVKIPATTTQFNLNRKKQNPPIQDRGNSGHGTNVQRGGSGTKTQGNSGQQIRLSGGGNDSAKEQALIEAEKKKRFVQYAIYAVVAIICCIGGWWGYTKLNPTNPEDPTLDNPIIAEETSATKNVSFRFIDFDGDQLSEATLQKLSVSFEPSSIVSKSDDGYVITYNNTANPPDTIKVNVSFQDIGMLKKGFQNIFVIQNLEDIVEIPLSVKGSDLKMFNQLEAEVNASNYDDYHNKINGKGGIVDRNYEYGILLNQKLGSKPDTVKKDENPKPDVKPETNVMQTPTSDIPSDLNETWLTVEHLKKKTGDQYKTTGAKARIATLKSILTGFQSKKIPSSDKNLAPEQARIVRDLITLKGKIDAAKNDDLTEKFYKQLAKKKSLNQVEDLTREGSYFNNQLNQ